MAIDIYEGSTRRLSLSEDAFLSLASAQDELRKRAGRTVDAYATTTIEPEHALLWLSGLRRILPALRDANARKACEDLMTLLADAAMRRKTLLIEGE